MPSIDNRVVEMEFDNQQFNSGIATSINQLDKLKKSLKLEDSVKNISNLDKAAKDVDLSSMADGVKTISDRFSTMGVIATTILARIANTAISTGAQLAKSLALDGIIDGFREYELQIGSIQTILGNTKSKGTTLDEVNAALDELNKYADLTIYNFGQMTENIGRFTAAGVDLDTSVASIKGISNLAALSGSSATQAASAMYQLSQAIAAGRIQLMDWNSVVNAGMGGEQFQNALKRTAEHFGTNVDAMIDKYGSFRESLTQGGWLTADVMTETLKQISGAYTEADLIAQGYTEQQAKEIVELANTATEAATKVRTFTQLFSTIKESIGSGWAQTWEIVIGDFEEATELFTQINDVVSGFVGKQADARNALAETWAALGGRQDLIDGLSTAFDNLVKIASAIRESFQHVFPPTTALELANLTKGFKNLMERLTPSLDTLDRFKRIASGVFSAFNLVRKGVVTLISPIGSLLGSDGFGGFLDMILEVAARIGDFITKIDRVTESTGFFEGVAAGLSETFSFVGDVLGAVSDAVGGFSGGIEKLGNTISKVFGSIKDAVSDVISIFTENFSGGDIFAGFAGAGLLIAGQSLSGAFEQAGGLFETISKTIDNLPFIGSGGKEEATSFSDNLGIIGDAISEFTNTIKVVNFVAIAVAVAMLSSAVKKLSDIPIDKLAIGLIGVSGAFLVLRRGFKSFVKALDGLDGRNIIKFSVAALALAKAVEILSNAIKKLSDIPLDKLATGLIGVGGGLAALVLAIKFIDGKKISLQTSIAILAIAQASKMLADAVSKFSGLSWDEIGRGLTGMGGALAELTIVLSILSKVGGGGALLGGAAILITVESLDEISQALKQIGKLSWEEIGRGLAGMGGALAEIAGLSGVLGKVTGVSGILGAGSIVLGAQALDEIGAALKEVGKLSWEEIGKGLAGVGGALAEIAGFSGVLGKVTGVSGILGAGAILLGVQSLDEIADALDSVSELSWEEIGKGLAGIGGALVEIAAISGIVGKLTGVSGILGSGTILIAAQALEPIANALNKVSGLSWEEIKIGLVGIGGALTEVALLSGVLGSVAGLSGLIGAGTILLAVQGLQPIADALTQISQLSWEEIQIGLVGMGGALAELAIGSALAGLTGLAGLVGAGTIALASQGLTQLADAFIKFSSMDMEAVQSGLIAMGAALGETALGGLLNTFSGLGALSIATMAEPLGVLADSVKKWEGVSIPEGLADQLGSLAGGVQAFTLSGFGAGAISTVAEPLGTMAESVGKWASISVPEGIGATLQDLAEGVNAFTLSGLAGFSMSTIIEPLGSLAESVNKWNGVNVPSDIKTNLENLAGGVGAFTLSGFSVGGLSSVIEPIGNLAKSAKKWNGVSIPGDIKTSLENLANGIKAFNDFGDAATNMSNSATAIANLSSAASSLVAIDFGAVSTNLSTFASSLQALPAQLSTTATSLGLSLTLLSAALSSIATSISIQAISIGMAAAMIKIAASGISTAISSQAGAISVAMASITLSVSLGMTSITLAIINGTTTIVNRFISLAVSLLGVGPMFITAGNTLAKSLIDSAMKAFVLGEDKFRQEGQKMVGEFRQGITSQRDSITNACRIIASAAASAIGSYGNRYYTAGLNASAGFANGIIGGMSSVINAATRVASNAIRAAEQTLGEHSPSKEFERIGLYADMGTERGFEKGSANVAKASRGMASQALDAARGALSSISDMIDNGEGFSLQPTITPVIDMNNVNRGAKAIDFMFNRTIGLSSSISSKMADRDRANAKLAEAASKQTSTEPTSISFTQNNYSPKALSRIDIYRDTKNQLSRMKKGALL